MIRPAALAIIALAACAPAAPADVAATVECPAGWAPTEAQCPAREPPTQARVIVWTGTAWTSVEAVAGYMEGVPRTGAARCIWSSFPPVAASCRASFTCAGGFGVVSITAVQRVVRAVEESGRCP